MVILAILCMTEVGFEFGQRVLLRSGTKKGHCAVGNGCVIYWLSCQTFLDEFDLLPIDWM